MRTVLLYLGIALTLAPKLAAQDVPSVRFTPAAQIYMQGAALGEIFIIRCARVTEARDSTWTITLGELAEPVVDHDKKTLNCPGGLDALVRTQAEGEPCAFSDQEKQVFRMRPERFRVLACKEKIVILARMAKAMRRSQT